MAWLYLFIAGIFEVAWAIGLKYSESFTRIYPSIFTIASMVISVYFLSLAVKSLPIGTAYGAWTGIGAVGTVVLGMLLFNEPRDIIRIIFLMLIVVGIVGLKFTSANS